MKPQCSDLARVKAMSEEVIVSHYQSNWALPRWRAVVYCLAMSLAPLLDTGPVLAEAREPLEPVQTIALPEVSGRIDHLDIDVDGERLFVAALGNDTVEVIDLRAGQRSARLEHVQEPQGVAYVPEAKRLFVANGRSGRVDIFEGASLAAAGHVDGLEDADNVRYERNGGHVYVGYGSGLATIEAATLKLVAQTKLAGHPESFQVESGTSRIFVNVPSAQHIAIVDRHKRSVLATWSLDDKKANFPMALDEPDHRVFVATRQPAALLVYDTDTGKRVADLSIGSDADDVFGRAQADLRDLRAGRHRRRAPKRCGSLSKRCASAICAGGAHRPLRGRAQDSVRRGSGAWTFNCRDPRLRGQVGRAMEQAKQRARSLQS
jgi:hypothetical protein